MKMRYMVITVTVLLLCAYLGINRYVKDDSYLAVDMLTLNEKYKKIEQDIGAGATQQVIEKRYGCSILFIENEDYKEKVYEAIQRGNVLIDYYDTNGELTGKIVFAGEADNYKHLLCLLKQQLGYIFIGMTAFAYLFLLWAYMRFVRPFQKMQRFAADISKGNLDAPLEMQKRNYFGAFTESFDIMREELKQAREGEYRANLSKKELVASLSHDIKTPVSTIKAVCEILILKIKEKDCLDKIQTIDQKADMIDSLISNMFHATLEELEALKIETTEQLSTIIKPMFEECDFNGEIIYENEIPECLIYADKLRLNQVIDNIIHNSYKYAGTNIYVQCLQEQEGIRIRIKDNGPGVDQEELALVTEKFYRGRLAAGKAGSGLGLYLSKLFMEKMHGSLECYIEDGFAVEIFIKRV